MARKANVWFAKKTKATEEKLFVAVRKMPYRKFFFKDLAKVTTPCGKH